MLGAVQGTRRTVASLGFGPVPLVQRDQRSRFETDALAAGDRLARSSLEPRGFLPQPARPLLELV
jgi:hypothetical protein